MVMFAIVGLIVGVVVWARWEQRLYHRHLYRIAAERFGPFAARCLILYFPIILFLLPNIRYVAIVCGAAGIDCFVSFFAERISQSRNGVPKKLLINLFGILGALSKSDGRISEDEIRLVEGYIQSRLALDQKKRAVAIDAFRDGATKQDYLKRARKLTWYFQEDTQALLLALQMVREMSLSGNVVHEREQNMIRNICRIWGIEIPGHTQEQTQFRQEQAYREQQPNVEPQEVPPDCFAFFGCTGESPAKDLKAKYRELCKKYHPDIARGKSFHPDYLRHSEETFKEIQLRWEEVCRLRNDL